MKPMSSKALNPSRVTRDSKKGIRIMDLVADQLHNANLDEDQAQRVIENPEFPVDVLALMRRFATPVEYADKEVASDYAYPDDFAVLPIGTQVDRLAAIYGLSLGYTIEFIEKVLPGLELPEGTDWFAIPSIDAVAARFFPTVKDPVERNSRAVQLMLEKLGRSRKLYNYREGQLGPNRLRPHPRTVEMLRTLQEQQPGDILIVAGQLGLRHRGRSVRRARAIFTANEFGAGAFAGGSILLTHPKRLGTGNELFMDLPGDEYADDDGRCGEAPCLDHGGGEVRFDAYWVEGYGRDYGSVSFFLPQ